MGRHGIQSQSDLKAEMKFDGRKTAAESTSAVGQPVAVSAQDSYVLVRPVGESTLTFEQKLTAFEPLLHGGEVLLTDPVGKEVL